MKATQVDLNADLGEGAPNDRELLQLVSSANISCGAHAGDADSIRTALQHAVAFGVAVGAHPSYPDREHMGRHSLDMPTSELRDSIWQQLTYLCDMASSEGARVCHVKAHGALYNDMATDQALAEKFCGWIREFDTKLTIVGLAGSTLLQSARHFGIRTRAEAFVDRRYQADGTLVPRSQPDAVIHDADAAIKQTLSIIKQGYLMTVTGQRLAVNAETFCVHGDTPAALLFASRLVTSLREEGIRIAS
ncbi:MAG TPA: LamB/YcsF family protein [Pseudohongiella sp.]|nr:LamB/YcsF family protein [Pseudohongiella sp.]|tara:strand:- start:53642 stop:54385 length:744 start_codon:yes stop_codon:yes gene_type:complete